MECVKRSGRNLIKIKRSNWVESPNKNIVNIQIEYFGLAERDIVITIWNQIRKIER